MSKTEEKNDVTNLIVKASSIIDQLNNRSVSNATSSQEGLYDALGYPVIITYEQYEQRFKRQDIANRVVKSPVDATWSEDPLVFETKEKDTQFEIAWQDLAVDLSLFYYFSKADLLAAIGSYSLLFLGFSDGLDLSMPVEKTSNIQLNYVHPIPEKRVNIAQWDVDITSNRYGMPLIYSVDLVSNIGSTTFETKHVHWSRVIHIAEGTIDSEVYGTPFMEPIYNRLIGLDKLAGGSPEMYWRGARPGYTAQANENTIVTDKQLEHLTNQLSSFVNNMQRWIYVEGMDITPLSSQVVSPKEHVEVQIKLISAATRIPIRMLTGSERGELASTQDVRAWLSFIEERRKNVGEDKVVRPFIDRMLQVGVLPPPETGEYFVEWTQLVVLSEKEKAEIAKIKVETIATYSNSLNASDFLPIEFVLRDLGFTESEIDIIISSNNSYLIEEDKERDKNNEVEAKAKAEPGSLQEAYDTL